jgi:hypothetical protein
MKSQVSVAKFPLSAGILYRGNPPALFTRRDVEWKCPKCGSADLKKVSLVYQDGLSQTKSRSRLFGFLLGTAGPAIVTGASVRCGTQQSDLSQSLNPPSKWSYTRLVACLLPRSLRLYRLCLGKQSTSFDAAREALCFSGAGLLSFPARSVLPTQSFCLSTPVLAVGPFLSLSALRQYRFSRRLSSRRSTPAKTSGF